MRRAALAAVLAAVLAAGCGERTTERDAEQAAAPAPPAPEAVPTPPAPDTAAVAEPAGVFPVRGVGPALPRADQTLTRIAVGSCSEETRDLPIFAAILAARPDLFLYLGDNVYGDARAGDMQLPELREAYGALNLNAHFAAFNMAVPMLAVWDDHDYGLNDAGADFPARELSERLFETYWGAAAVGREHPGVYGARVFGPPGRRVQVILLDTRFFRSPLKRGEPDAEGRRGPYVAQTEPGATLLGEAQWRWLETALREPAEVRLVASSIQVLAEGHPYESWDKMPNERRRLFDVVRRSGARGVVLLSGDRHVAGMYRTAGAGAHPLSEMTTSSLNLNFVKSDAELTRHQIGRVYTPANFGLVEIDWAGRSVGLSVRGLKGEVQRRMTVPFGEIGI